MSDDVVGLLLDEANEKMVKAVEHTRHEMAGVRTGRASSALVEKLAVDYFGAEVPLQQMAGFSVPEARMLVITPYDKSAMGAIEKALQQSNLGLNPSNDGNAIRLAFPPLTEERRKDLVRHVRQMAEDGRIAIRNLRRATRHELEGLEKDGDLSEDELARAEKDLDKVTHRSEGDIDAALEQKEKELMEV